MTDLRASERQKTNQRSKAGEPTFLCQIAIHLLRDCRDPANRKIRLLRARRTCAVSQLGSAAVRIPCLLAAAIAIHYFSRSRTTSEVFWTRATARAFPSGDH